MATDDEHKELLDAAGDLMDDEAEAPEVPRCPECGRPIDDVSKMSSRAVLEGIRDELARDLLRDLRNGTATHQEKAIARGFLRDNHSLIPDDDDGEEGDLGPGVPRGRTRKKAPRRPPYSWEPGGGSEDDYSDTDGG